MIDTNAFRSFTLSAGTIQRDVTPGPLRVHEAIVGEPMKLTADVPVGELVCSVTSTPAGSSSSFDGAHVTLDRPGRYKLTAKNGAMPAVAFEVIALPPEALDDPDIATAKHSLSQTRSLASRRSLLRAIVNGALFTGYQAPPSDADWSALTARRPLPGGLNFGPYHDNSEVAW